ncbi:hypothetical protein F751_0827 [Auxenochlorella protothecoides]|uniref:Uncharacterized protein n=1 Tax=Auxenochlorella protothecoides TaxID=3075 RepID=A0A087SBH4_AUXPR|nr:hypothetical protein F751_0827 [Auxenochlorella protothecoides]KFM23078.1 hypothetical protein F751_0827 [Auxenochlorella protothecoides]
MFSILFTIRSRIGPARMRKMHCACPARGPLPLGAVPSHVPGRPIEHRPSPVSEEPCHFGSTPDPQLILLQRAKGLGPKDIGTKAHMRHSE